MDDTELTDSERNLANAVATGSTIVSGVTTMVSNAALGSGNLLGAKLQDAMHQAVVRAQAEGITDVEELKRLKQEAYNTVLQAENEAIAAYHAQEAAARAGPPTSAPEA